MTVVAIDTRQRPIPGELEREILARIDRAGLHVCEAELRHTLRWDEHKNGSLLDLLDELEQKGLIESALHFRLTDHGRARLPDSYEPPLRYGTGIPWRARHERTRRPDPPAAARRARRRARARQLRANDRRPPGAAPMRRAIDVCRRAGLHVVDPHDCTCTLCGCLVVVARSSGGLQVLRPYNERCPIHTPRDHEEPPTPRLERARGDKRLGGTGGEDTMSQDNNANHGAAWRDRHLIATYAVELIDPGPEPDWHRDRTLFQPWARYELIARNIAGDQLARARGSGNAECGYRLAGELRSAMHWIR